MKVNTENIFQVIEIPVSCSDIYDAFLNESRHSQFTGMTAEIDGRIGGEFSACDGRATGRILQLVKNKRIVVAWTHKRFPANHFTIVDMKLESNENGCRISFNHTGLPESCDGWMTDTWQKTYWVPLREYMESAVEA